MNATEKKLIEKLKEVIMLLYLIIGQNDKQ
jgi:hypothetical protein